MTYSKNFPKQPIVRRKKIVMPTDKHRNTTGRIYSLPPAKRKD